MEESKFNKALELIGFDFDSKKMKVLRSLMRAQMKLGDELSFADIYSQIISDENNEEMDSSLVYRCLTMLEKERYLEIDRRSYRHLYHTDYYIIEQALMRLKEAKLQVLRKQRKILDQQILSMLKVDFRKSFKKLQKILSGPQTKTQPRFAYGAESIYWMIDSEIYDRAKPDDIIRMTLDWLKPDQERRSQRFTVARALSKRGVKIRALMHSIHELDASTLKCRIKIYSQLKSQNSQVIARASTNSPNTYQFVARNSIGIVLIVSENPLTGMWIPRASNASLVDDAVKRFDEDFSDSRDIQCFV